MAVKKPQAKAAARKPKAKPGTSRSKSAAASVATKPQTKARRAAAEASLSTKADQAPSLLPGPLNPEVFPYIFHCILDFLDRDSLVCARDATKRWRQEIDKRLFRHLVIRNPNLDKPVYFHTPSRRSTPVPWSSPPKTDYAAQALQQHSMSLMRRHCQVLDYAWDGLFIPTMLEVERREALNMLRSLPHVAMLRRFSKRDFEASADIVVDFCGYLRSATFRCNRYVVPNILAWPFARRFHGWPEPQVVKGLCSGGRIQGPLKFAGILDVQEIVLIFIEGYTDLHDALELCHASLRTLLTELVKFVFVGVKRQDQDLQDELEDHLDRFALPSNSGESITFFTHAEYCEDVGKEQYALETDPRASVW